MKIKTIAKILKKQTSAWLDSIADEGLRKKVESTFFVAGGFIASSLLQEDPIDIDIYFSDVNVAAELATYYLTKADIDGHAETGVDSVSIMLPEDDIGRCDVGDKPKRFTPVVFTENAVSLTGDIQLIMRFVDDPSTVVNGFDFVHTKNYWLPDVGLVLNTEALASLLTRELRYTATSLFPVCCLFRVKKFIKRGWSMTAGEMLKVIIDASLLDLMDPEVLREQLIGVDIAYFLEVVDSLKRNQSETLDRTFLFSVIDEVFNEGSEHDA